MRNINLVKLKMRQFTWRSFGSNILANFDFLHKFQKFADVTLVSEDQIEYEAHRAVLAACSPVLRNLLHEGSSRINLAGVYHEELQALIEFIYLGQTVIAATRYDEFFNFANNLSLHGLLNQLNLAFENVGIRPKQYHNRKHYACY